jgi:hypothetical protein
VDLAVNENHITALTMLLVNRSRWL